MSKVIDLEGEIPLHSVQLDGLVGLDHLSSPRSRSPSRRCSMGTYPGAVCVSIMAEHTAPTDDVQFHAAKGRWTSNFLNFKSSFLCSATSGTGYGFINVY